MILNGDENFYIVMEYASNGALSKYLADRRSRVQPLSEEVSLPKFVSLKLN